MSMTATAFAVGAPSSDTMVTFKEGCELLRISPPTATRHNDKAKSDLPRWFWRAGRKYYWTTDIAEYWARKRKETRRELLPLAGSASPADQAGGIVPPRAMPPAVGVQHD